MQTVMISGALFFVMILLLLVVYDSNPTVRRLAGKLWPFHGPRPKQERKEPSMNHETDPAVPSREPKAAAAPVRRKRGLWRFFPFRFPRRGSPGPIPSRATAEQSEPPPARAENTAEPPPRKSKAEALTALEDAISNLTGRLSQAETAIEKIAHLETEVAKVAEATEIVSQDFKDILGSLRSTIDGLESRLNEMGSQIQEVKGSVGAPANAPAAGGPDEETRGRIKALEKAVADMADTVRSLPDDVRRALTNSRKAAGEAEEIGKRLEVISSNLQMTLGYGIKKAFRCDSCGSQGFVASRVVCSKCGTPSWWGWWPVTEESPESDSEESPETPDELENALQNDAGGDPLENIEPLTQIEDQ